MSNLFSGLPLRLAAVATGVALVAGGATAASAGSPGHGHPGHGGSHTPSAPAGTPQLEKLDRGLVATSTSEGVFVSWRLLVSEATGSSETGLTGTDFTVYRDGAAIATVTDSTNLLDAAGAPTSQYSVAPVVGGVEGESSPAVSPWANGYVDLPLQKPADGVTPKGEAYTYSANDMSVGDVDGDGSYEYIVKWDPSNSKDVSQIGYTGNVFVDTYKADGRLLNRIDLGVNIRAGAHYTQVLAYDYDGDGKSELLLKTAPGTKSTTFDKRGNAASESFISLPKEDRKSGVTHQDDYRVSTSGYYEHVVDMFVGWQNLPEVASGQWPATLEEAFGIPVTHEYPLSRADAAELTDYFMDVYAPSRSARNNLRAFEGFILSGPEYMTMFDGASGKELQTVPVKTERYDDGLAWGDYAMSRIEPGNRVDRYLGGVAYLDGVHPSAIFARGYYTRSTIVAYDWNGKKLTERWYVDSGFPAMTNPFNDSPHGRDGSNPEFASLTTQGFHSLSASDVDGDGKHEVVYGSATIDDDGSLLYSSTDTLPAGSAAPGTEARLGHGDAMHVTDIDPNRAGLEIFTVHEGATSAPYGYALRDAATGEVIYGEYSGKDTGRGMIGDIDPAVPGIETWATRLRSASGDSLAAAGPGTNQSIRWAADGTTQIVNGTADADVTIDSYTNGRLLTATGTRSNNGTKGTANLVADVFGDWREELLVRTADSSAIRIFLSTDVTDQKLYTLMHDKQYRAEVARQNTAYNQPSYPGFYLASDTDFSKVPLLTVAVTPAAVTFSDTRRSDSYTIPSTPGVRYVVKGKVVKAGTYRVSRSTTVTVTAVPLEWYFIAPGATSTWEHKFNTRK
jgi:rhamnogalacturonan endolyase